ncbi:MAG: hypothetical protein GY727_06570, partial [Gammaproteobacteria bacterium]|nr:hypothetical protein [Gammaproteobacteria bacterium]
MTGSNQVSNVVSSVVTPVALSGVKTPLLNQFEGAAAAYSLRRLKSWDDGSRVVRVRRESDNTERDFSSVEVSDGTMARWVNEQPTLPLDLRELDTNTGERDGALIEAAAAYSLRKLKEDFTGDVVEVRRNVDGETEGFTATEVTDGTMEGFVKGEEVIYESDFSAGEDGWERAYPRVTLEGDIDGIGGRDNCLRIMALEAASPWFGKQNIIRKGARYKVSYEFYTEGDFGINLVSNGYAPSGNSNGNWVSYEADFISDNNFLQFIRPYNDYPAYIRNVKVISYAENELPLDQATGAAAAYSLRNLSSSYTGNVVEVRRSSDDAEESFTASEVADGTLTDWVVEDVADLIEDTMYFDGVDDFVSIGTGLNTATNGDTAFTLKADITTFASGTSGDIISNQRATGSFSGIAFRKNTSDQLQFTIGTGTNRITVSTTGITVNDGEKHTVQLDYDGSKTAAGVTFTVDGVVASKSVSTDAMTQSVVAEKPMTIGARDGGASLFWQGTITNITVVTSTYDGSSNVDSGWLDTSANSNNGTVNGSPALFTGQGYDGFVKNWYDQSGSDNHAVQTDTAKQPKIVNGGTLVTGGIDFDGAGQKLVTPTTSVLNIDGAKDKSIFAKGTFPVENFIFLGNIGESGEAIRYRRKGINARFEVEGGGVNGGSLLGDDGAVYSSIFSGTQLSDSDVSSNGSITDGTGTLSINTANTVLDIGYLDGTLSEGAGQLSELIIYDSDQSTKRRAIEENIA